MMQRFQVRKVKLHTYWRNVKTVLNTYCNLFHPRRRTTSQQMSFPCVQRLERTHMSRRRKSFYENEEGRMGTTVFSLRLDNLRKYRNFTGGPSIEKVPQKALSLPQHTWVPPCCMTASKGVVTIAVSVQIARSLHYQFRQNSYFFITECLLAD